jgi:hypothetical protein
MDGIERPAEESYVHWSRKCNSGQGQRAVGQTAEKPTGDALGSISVPCPPAL